MFPAFNNHVFHWTNPNVNRNCFVEWHNIVGEKSFLTFKNSNNILNYGDRQHAVLSHRVNLKWITLHFQSTISCTIFLILFLFMDSVCIFNCFRFTYFFVRIIFRLNYCFFFSPRISQKFVQQKLYQAIMHRCIINSSQMTPF